MATTLQYRTTNTGPAGPPSAAAQARPTRVRLGRFTLDLKAGELSEGSCKTVLQGQPHQVLLMLVEHPGDVVLRQEIQQRLWPDGVVVNFEVGISQAVKKLRRALHDCASNPQYIETVGRRGYRLKVPVTVHGLTTANAGDDATLDYTSLGICPTPFTAVVCNDERRVLADVLRQLLEVLAYVGRSLQQSAINDARTGSSLSSSRINR